MLLVRAIHWHLARRFYEQSLGLEVVGGTAEAFGAVIAREIPRWKEVAASARIRVVAWIQRLAMVNVSGVPAADSAGPGRTGRRDCRIGR